MRYILILKLEAGSLAVQWVAIECHTKAQAVKAGEQAVKDSAYTHLNGEVSYSTSYTIVEAD